MEATEWNRTLDLRVTNALLSRLSYVADGSSRSCSFHDGPQYTEIVERREGFEPIDRLLGRQSLYQTELTPLGCAGGS